MRRWILLLIAVVIVLAGAAISAHVILRGDLPRRLVVDVLQRETGLRIEARELVTTWRGATTVRDLSATLPFETEPFITLPEIRLSHASLLRLLVFRSLDLEELVIDQPRLRVTMDADGRWNLAEALEIVARAQAGKLDADGGGLIVLPRLRLHEAVVEAAARDGRLIRFAPFSITGDPDDSLAWSFAVHHGADPLITGRLAPTAGWRHELSFDLQAMHSFIEPWLPEAPSALHASGVWRGRMRDGALTGSMTLETVRAAPLTLRGEITVRAAGGDLVIETENLHVEADDAPIGALRITGGTVSVNQDAAKVERLRLHVDELSGEVEGAWRFASSEGSVSMTWRGKGPHQPIEHEGRLEATLTRGALGMYEAALSTDLRGRWNDATWETRLRMEGSGPSWMQGRGTMRLDSLSWRDQDVAARLADARSAITWEWPMLTLSDLRVPGEKSADDRAAGMLTGGGRVNVETFEWSADLTAKDWAPPVMLDVLKAAGIELVNARVVARGDTSGAVIERLDAAHEGVTLKASGRVGFADRSIVLTTALSGTLPAEHLPDGVRIESFRTSAAVSGAIESLRFDLRGQLDLVGVMYDGRAIELPSLRYTAETTREGVNVTLDEFAFLDSPWNVRGELDFAAMLATALVRVEELSIERLKPLVDMPIEARGRVGVDLTGRFPLADPASGTMDGTWRVTDLAALDLPPVSGTGRVTIAEGNVHVSEIHLADRAGVMTGEARLALARPDHLHVKASLTDWPVVLAMHDLALTVAGETALEIDLANRRGQGAFTIDVNINYLDEAYGAMTFNGELAGDKVSIADITGRLLGSDVSGSGEFMLDPARWMESRLEVVWRDFDLANLSRLVEHPVELEPLIGTSRGRLSIHRAADPRAPEPMRLELAAELIDVRYKQFVLGNGDEASAEFVAKAHFGRDRLLLDEASIRAAGGDIRLWGRLSRHGEQLAAHVNMDFDRLDLQQLVHAVDLTDEPMPGRVSGTASFGGYLDEPHRLYGRARVRLAESDLIGLPGIAQVFSALRLEIGTLDPTGVGQMDLRLEGHALEIGRLVYFNRGTDILAQLRIEDIRAGGASPIRGLAVGFMRPLKDINLPYLDVVDRLIKAAQSDAASVRIRGTLEDSQVEVVPLREMFGSVERLLNGLTE